MFEYYFNPDDKRNAVDTNGLSNDMIESYPKEIKELLKADDLSSGELNEIAEEYLNYGNLLKKITKSFISVLFPCIKETLVLFCVILLSGLIRTYNQNKSFGNIINLLTISGIIVLSVNTDFVSMESIEAFKDLICGIMNGIVPTLGLVYTVSGNVNTAAVQSGGAVLLATICQNLFAGILIPSVKICLVMSFVAGLFSEINLRPITTAFKNISNVIILSSVTLFSFVLSIQNSISQSADSVGARSIKFAISQIIPIIGGAVSDSLGAISGSLSLLKSSGGAIAIVCVILLVTPTIAGLIVKRFSLFLCKSCAGILGCATEEKLFEDLGSVISLMLAFTVAISISFIYILTLFVKSSIALI